MLLVFALDVVPPARLVTMPKDHKERRVFQQMNFEVKTLGRNVMNAAHLPLVTVAFATVAISGTILP